VVTLTQSVLNIRAAHEAIRAQRVRLDVLLSACLANVEQHEREVHAWAYVAADSAREQIGAAANVGLPLAGVSIGVKDIIDVQGMPTRAGSPWYLCDAGSAAADAVLVAKLRAAGAILLGKTVTTEFAYLDPSPTRNPWNLERTPGGSSSGSAAAVAAGMCVAAIGTQTGGSTIRPAAFCGVVGFKPTRGWIDPAGIVPLAVSLDHPGIFARSVDDTAIVYSVLTGRAPADLPAVQPSVLFAATPLFARAEPATAQVVREVLNKLAAAQATVGVTELPDSYATVHANHLTIMAAEAAQTHQVWFPQHRAEYGPRIRDLIERGQGVSAAELLAARGHRQQFQGDLARWFAEQQAKPPGRAVILAMPAATGPAPDRSTTGDPSLNSPWSYAGLPAITIPCGQLDGLPLGLQLVGPAGSELQLLEAAAWCEAVLKCAG